MNGPKGIGSFRVLIFETNKIIDIIAPEINDKNIFKNMYLTPKTKPKEPMRVTSPPPIPPRDRNIIAANKPPAKNNPKKLFVKFKGVPYKKLLLTLCTMDKINMHNTKLSGITISFKSINTMATSIDDIKEKNTKFALKPNFRYIVMYIKAFKASTNGYCKEIPPLQYLHLPFSHKYENNGILSYHLRLWLQAGQ
jgi:hypothetical protein